MIPSNARSSYADALRNNRQSSDWHADIPRRFLSPEEFVLDVLPGVAARDAVPLFVLTEHRFLYLPLKRLGSHYVAADVPLRELAGAQLLQRSRGRREVEVRRSHGEPMLLPVRFAEDAERFVRSVHTVMSGRTDPRHAASTEVDAEFGGLLRRWRLRG